MTAGYSAEHDELGRVVRQFLKENSPNREVRRFMAADGNRDDAVWAQMAGQLSLQEIAIPEQYGGAGYGPVELGIVLEEMGTYASRRGGGSPSGAMSSSGRASPRATRFQVDTM